MTIVWFMDRFGIPGQYRTIWSRLLNDNGVRPTDVRIVSLHNILQRQLLTRLGSRKAPTWIPEEGLKITQAIDTIIERLKPSAVVLASPESLACLGLAPEHATLQALRGSVYWRSGVPHLVMLPMSAWTSMVTQKEIGAANYGFESQDAFAAGRTGQVPASASETAGRDGSGNGGAGISTAVRTGQVPPAGSTLQSVGLDPKNPFAHLSVGANRTGGVGTTRSQRDTGVISGRDDVRVGHDVQGGLRGQLQSEDDGADLLGGAESEALESEAGADTHAHAGAADGGDGELYEDSGVDDGGGSLSPDVDRSESGSDGEDEPVESDEDEPDKEEGEMDQFFYEPVLSPVGRFVLTADTMKLFRLLRDGKNAAGPSRPITLRWR